MKASVTDTNIDASIKWIFLSIYCSYEYIKWVYSIFYNIFESQA